MGNLLELFSSMDISLRVQFLAALLASLLIGAVLGASARTYRLGKRLHKREEQRIPQEIKAKRIEFYQDIILSFEEHYSQIYDEKSGVPKLIRQGYRKHIHEKVKPKITLADKKIGNLHNQIMFHINRKTLTDEELASMAIDFFNEVYDQIEYD